MQLCRKCRCPWNIYVNVHPNTYTSIINLSHYVLKYWESFLEKKELEYVAMTVEHSRTLSWLWKCLPSVQLKSSAFLLLVPRKFHLTFIALNGWNSMSGILSPFHSGYISHLFLIPSTIMRTLFSMLIHSSFCDRRNCTTILSLMGYYGKISSILFYNPIF